MNGLPYYKAYPRDFIEGTIGMGFELKGAYRIVLDLIYMQGGQLPDDARYISGMLGCSVKKWSSYRDQLIALGKLKVSEGCLINNRAVIEIENLTKLQDKQRENRSRPNKNNDLQSPRCDQPEPEPDTLVSGGMREREVSSSSLPDDATDRERILDAIGVDPVSGLTGRGGTMLGRPEDGIIAARWLALPGMNIDRVCEVIREVMASKHDGPPSSYRYFDPAMARRSGKISLPPLEPVRVAAGQSSPAIKFDLSVFKDK